MADKEIGGWGSLSHSLSHSLSLSQNTRKTHAKTMRRHIRTGGSKTTIQQRTHPQNRHETLTRPRDHPLETSVERQRSHIIGQSSHCSNSYFGSSPGRTTDGRGTPQIRAPSPSHRGALSRAHAASLARTHARNAIAIEIEIDFPIRGQG